jgi:hypothetical protein
MAENVSTLSIDVGLNAEKAMSGLGKLGDMVDGLGKTVANFGKAAVAGAFTWLATKAVETAGEFARFADQSDKLGKSLGAMYGNVNRGGEILGGLSKISSTTGTNVENLAASMEKLAGAGFGLGKSLEILQGGAELDWLFGGNGKGVAEISGGIASLNGQMVASADLFDKLRAKGVNAYDDLGKAIGTTAAQAERMVKAGRITGFQGAQAIAASLQGSDAKAKRAEADTTLGRLGQLAPGFAADVVAWDFRRAHLTPLLDPLGTLVHDANGRDVEHVWIGGRQVVESGRPTQADESAVRAAAQTAAEGLWQRARDRKAA